MTFFRECGKTTTTKFPEEILLEYEKLMDIIKHRGSCRSYLSKQVEEEKIKKCLEAARHAPSACNKQPWRFGVVTDDALRKEICEDGLLPGIPMPWLNNCPAIVVLCAETNIVTHKLAPMLSRVQYHLIDIGIAGEHFVLAAESLGLGTCWIGWFKPKKIRKILKIPRQLQILSLISLGYPDEPVGPPEKLTVGEICY